MDSRGRIQLTPADAEVRMLREIESRTGLSERETYRSGLHVLFWLLQAGRLGETLEAAKGNQ